MTNEERDLIIQFVGRTGGNPATSGFAASVPTAGVANLPPVDPQADALIAELFVRYPEARYRLTQLAFIQEHALAAASGQLEQLKQQNAQLQQQIQQMAQQAAPAAPSPWGQPAQAQPQSRGFLGGLFGGGQPAPQPQPQYAPQPQPQYAPQYAPGYQPGMFQQGGNGFLGSALRTATGVAGGMLAAEAIGSLFEGHHAAQGGGFGGGFGQPSSFGNDASPWAAVSSPAPAAPAFDPYDQGGALKDDSWANAAPVDTGWQDASNGGDSGWSDSGGGGDFDNS